MKKFFLLLIFLISVYITAFASENEKFNQFLRNINSQAANFKNSELHKNIKAEKNTQTYIVGDTTEFWSWDLSVMPPLWIQTPSTCRAVGEKSYLFIADDQWNINIDQDAADSIMAYLEDHTFQSSEYGAIEMDENLFGPLPDELDNDPKVIVFYSALGSFMTSTFDGYFSAYNQVTEEEAQQMSPPGHSNECEMIYMTCYPLDPTEPIRFSVLAHELQHMIHWGMDEDEDTWVDEGCAELAMVYFGVPDPIIIFPNNPDNSLNLWSQEFSDYVKVMLFFTYLDEHYGTDSLIKDIVAESLNGILGIENQLSVNNSDKTFREIFFDWTIANILDIPEIDSGLYNYESLNLPDFSPASYETVYPADGSGTIYRWAADYIWIYPDDSSESLTFNLSASAPVDLAIVLKGDDGILPIVSKHERSNNFEIVLPEITEDYLRIELVLSNSSDNYIMYNYNVTHDATIIADNSIKPEDFMLTCYPNPFNAQTNISFSLKEAMPVSIEIFNNSGQKIKSIYENKMLQNGPHIIHWDGKNEQGITVSSGLYFYRLKTNKSKVSKKLIMLK